MKIVDVNAHLHTPYSFSAFDSVSQALCHDLTVKYPNVSCVDTEEDGRIKIRVSQESMSGGIPSGCTGPGCDEEGGT